MPVRHLALSAVVSLTVAAGSAFGQEPASKQPDPSKPAESRPAIVLQMENDFFSWATNEDRHYTNGLRITAVWPHSNVWVPFLDAIARHDPFVDLNGMTVRRNFVIEAGQSMFTPNDTEVREPILDDRPYAAWLYVGTGLQTIYESPTGGDAMMDTVMVEAGVVGRYALGEELQNSVHRLINVDEAKGWRNQLENEPGFNINFERQYRTKPLKLFDQPSLSTDIVPSFAFAVGNVATHFGFGGIFRLGQGLAVDFGPPRIRPSLPGSEAFYTKGGLAWYLFAGAEVRVVARDIFLDGNTFDDNSPVDKKHYVGDFRAGIAFVWGATRLSYTHTLRTAEFDGQDSYDQFGSVTLSFVF